jgi:phosphoglycolate phosphatase-like HAD superfamily hydrolase
VHLVWDWNGTLLDDLSLVVAATNASLASVGGPSVTVEEHRRDFHRPVASYYAHVLGRPVGDDEFRALDAAFHLAYAELVADCALASGAVEALTGWGGTQSLLSMWFHHELVPCVERYGLTPYFVRVDGQLLAPDGVGGGYKAPHLARHLAALGRAGDECVLIGDSVDDAEAASAVGARVVLYSGGFTHHDRLTATGFPVTTTLAEAVALAAEGAAQASRR